MSDKTGKNQKQTQCWCGFCLPNGSHCKLQKQKAILQNILPIGFYKTPLEPHSPVSTRSKKRAKEGIQILKKIYYQSEDEQEQPLSFTCGKEKDKQWKKQKQYQYNRLKAQDYQEDKNKNFYPQICILLCQELQSLGANPALYKRQLLNGSKAKLLQCFKQRQLSKYFSQIFLSQKLIRSIQLSNASVQNRIKSIKRLNRLKKTFIEPFLAANVQGKQELQGFRP